MLLIIMLLEKCNSSSHRLALFFITRVWQGGYHTLDFLFFNDIREVHDGSGVACEEEVIL